LSQYSQFGRSCSAIAVSRVDLRCMMANRVGNANGEFPSI
jgi:hypothetical protein